MTNLFKPAVLAAACLISLNAVAGNIAAGKEAAQKYNCASCHGADYNTPIDPAYPKLAGQHKDYLERAMIAYQRGGNGPNGRANAIMESQVKPLNRKEIQDIAAYLNSLPGALYLRK